MNTSLPINVDLMIQCKAEHLFSDQVGGNPDSNLTAINNIVYKCVASFDNKYVFHYDRSNTKTSNNSKYLGKGSNTVVMSMIQHTGQKELDGKTFVMRVTELNETIKIQKYIEDRNLCGRYIPSLYYYGILHCDGGVKLNYVISQKCEVLSKNNIEKMTFENKKTFLKDLIECLVILQKYGYVLWDLKIDNIGYVNGYECVIIDYDEKTILPEKLGLSTNTYYPTYYYFGLSFHKKYSNEIILQNMKYDKFPIAGLADVILNLFFKIKRENIITQASLFHLHIGGLYSSVNTNNSSYLYKYDTTVKNSNWWNDSYLNLANGVKIKEYLSLVSTSDEWNEFHSKLINIMFNYELYTGLLSPDYTKIPYFSEVRENLFHTKNEIVPINALDMVGGKINYKKKYEKYLKLNKLLLQNK